MRGTYFDFLEAGTRIWATVVHDGLGALGNAGIVDLGGQTLIFDTTQSIAAAEELREMAKKYTGRDVTLVVNSHAHNDHVFGNQVFRDVPILSAHRVRQTMVDRMPPFLEFAQAHPEYPQILRDRLANTQLTAQARWELERDAGDVEHVAAHLREYEMTLPTWCMGTELHLHGTDRSAHLMVYDAAHSAADLTLYVPEEHVLFAGDLASVGYHPSMKDGHPSQWISALDQVLTRELAAVVTGHGPVGTRWHVELTRQYLIDMISTAKATRTDEWASMPHPYDEWRGGSWYVTNLKFLKTWLTDQT